MTIELKPEERLDDLQRNGFKIIQNPGKFCFGMDAVLLSGFAKVKQGEKVLDLGTGTGIPLHADTFNFDERVLLRGVRAYQQLLFGV